PTQCLTPAVHSPASVPQLAPPSGSPSSTVPSQSSSSPLQVSATGPTAPSHTITPPRHISVPLTHSPTALPHAPPPPGLPSSIEPSQSSSRPLHDSGPPPVAPTHTSAP